MIVLSREEVAARLDPDALIDAVATALADVSAGRASMPPRIAAHAPRGLLAAMPAYLPSLDVLAAKLVAVFPEADPSHEALIAVFDPRTGTPVAILDGTEITAQRTAAASALATKWLAREDAEVLAIVGNGVQAAAHARYVTRVRKFREVRVAGRDRRKTAQFAAQIGARPCSIEEAVSDADVICGTTHSPDALIGEVKPGAHVNSVGLHPRGSELSQALVRRARIVVESRASALAPPPAGAFELQGLDAEELGSRPSRRSPDEITLYKSVGVAAEDAAAAALVLRDAPRHA